MEGWMESCCVLAIIGIVGFVFFFIYESVTDAQEAKRKLDEAARQAQYAREKAVRDPVIAEIDQDLRSVNDCAQSADNAVNTFFFGMEPKVSPSGIILINRRTEEKPKVDNIILRTASQSYDMTLQGLQRNVSSIQNYLETMTQKNSTLQGMPGFSRTEDREQAISKAKTVILPKVMHYADGFISFMDRAMAIPGSNMVDEENYGRIHKEYWDTVTASNHEGVIEYINTCEKMINSRMFDNAITVDLNRLLICIWFLATEQTFSANDFQKAVKLFCDLFKKPHADVIIADLYARKKMGGESVLYKPVKEMLDAIQDASILTLVASGLMWMGAYQTEQTVLQHMLSSRKEMTAKTQERLHSLTNGGGKAPSGYNVSSDKSLYFDVSALAWRDEEYSGFFENLAFQDRHLTYSLAIRDEDKNLFLSHGISAPNHHSIFEKIRAVFSEEYSVSADAKIVNCVALSGSGEEKLDGILAASTDCAQLGVLVHVAAIGKKLIIKFYTLFMPVGTNVTTQKQQALSMYKKLSPVVAMWESSLKDTMLMAIQQYLNASDHENGSVAPSNEDETVF